MDLNTTLIEGVHNSSSFKHSSFLQNKYYIILIKHLRRSEKLNSPCIPKETYFYPVTLIKVTYKHTEKIGYASGI